VQGQVLVALCSQARFTGQSCEYSGRVVPGGMLILHNVAPGRYAVQAIHDENGNGRLDRGLLRPTEGMGFSRDAPMRRGPPAFADAAVSVREPSGLVRLTIRYFQ
jgi:uncharacterized protein (DUF2141 family)